MRIPPLKIKVMLESNPLQSRISVRRLAAGRHETGEAPRALIIAIIITIVIVIIIIVVIVQ